MDRSTIILVAKELNDVLGCEPAIIIKGKSADIIAGITEAMGIIEEGDVFTETTQTFLDELKNPTPPPAKPTSKKKKKPPVEKAVVVTPDGTGKASVEILPKKEADKKEAPKPPRKPRVAKDPFTNPANSTFMIMRTCENEDITNEEMAKLLEADGRVFSMNAIGGEVANTRKTIAYLKQLGKMK